jgi:hypothetical protein
MRALPKIIALVGILMLLRRQFMFAAPEPLSRLLVPKVTTFSIPDLPDRSIPDRLWRITGAPGSPLDHCNATSQVKILALESDETNEWELQSVDAWGDDKIEGGDEFYITFTDYSHDAVEFYIHDTVANRTTRRPTAVALPADTGDGSYRLEFVTTPAIGVGGSFTQFPQTDIIDSGMGFLTVHFVYTCGIGRLSTVAEKINWENNGSTKKTYVVHNVTAPSMRAFVSPTIDKRLSDYVSVAVFGDSVMGQFVGQYRQNPNFRRYRSLQFPLNKKLNFKSNIRMSYQVNATINEIKKMLMSWHDTQLRGKANTALLLGSGMWDLKRISREGGTLEQTLLAYRHFIGTARKLYPNTTILWKSQSAVHVHNIDSQEANIVEGTKYLSCARVEELEKQTRALMKELNVAILDLYEATYLSSHWLYPDDAAHFRHEMNLAMLRWFY